MSTEQSIDPELVEQTKQQIRNLVREIAQIAKSEVSPADFYDAVLNRIVTALAAIGGAVWTVSESGQLALEYQINLRETRLAESEEDQVRHARLLRKVISTGEGMLAPPHSGSGNQEEGANPTDFLLVMGPLKTANETAGVLEIFQRPGASPTVQRGYLRFLLQMCDLASEYLKSRKLQHFTDRQALWAQLENFTRLVHKSLDTRGTAYTIANEGRRLIDCDRVSVAIAKGRKCVIEAISGQDTFDKRSNTVMLLSRLAGAVIATGETVWYTGDTSAMAPQVEEAVHDYVDECHSKAVAIVPLKEPHDTNDPTAQPKVLGALIVEQIEDSRPRDGMLQRIEIVGDHSSIALSNAREYNELFLMPVWRALGKSKWILEARQLPYTISIGTAVVVALLVLCLWPADFELNGKGRLQPVVRREVFANENGDVAEVLFDHGETVNKGDVLARLNSSELTVKLRQTEGELSGAEAKLINVMSSLENSRLRDDERSRLLGEQLSLQPQVESLKKQLNLYELKRKNLNVTSPIDGQLITWDAKQTLIGRPVQVGNALMTVVDPEGDWEVEIPMSEKYMGYIVNAQSAHTPDLRVKYITATNPGVTHYGKVKEVHRTAEVRGEEGNTVLVRVAINKQDLTDLRNGAEVTAKVYCGRASLGYVWLHELVSWANKQLFKWF